MLPNSLTISAISYLGIFILFVFIGFFRSIVQNKKPDFILDQKKIQKDWLDRNPFTSILLPIMALTIFAFNIIAWFVFGIISIAEFIGFIFKAIWWVLFWIWNELVHPVIFFLLKLIWHYIIIWNWRFFKFSFNRIPEAFRQSTLKNGFIATITLSFIFFFFLYLSRLLQQDWILIISFIALLFAASYFSGFTLYKDENRNFKDYWNGKMISILSIIVSISILSIAIIIILNDLYGTSLQLPIFGLSFPIIQVLILTVLIGFISILVSNTILPAYISSSDGNFDTKDFLLNMIRRLPRLLGVIPNFYLGGAIVLIPTAILGAFLWFSTNTIKTELCDITINSKNSELNLAKTYYENVYNNVNLKNLSVEYPKRIFKRIAKLESRLFYLDQIREDWGDIILNLSDGIRSVEIERPKFKFLNRQFQTNVVEISNIEKSIVQLNSQLSTSSNNKHIIENKIKNEEKQINDLKAQQIILKKRLELDSRLADAKKTSIIWSNIMWVIGTFLSLFGFVLLTAIILTPFWIYRTKVYFDLYDYYEDGESYFKEQVTFYKSKNENQPLLGLFITIFIIPLIILLFKLSVF